MGFLSAEGSPSEVSVGFRRGRFRHVRIALASAGWLAVIVASIKLLAERPREGFGLLAQWGPWPILALVAICFVGGFLASLNETVRMSFSSMVESARDGAQAQARMADAVTQLAKQGGRQAEETRRLAIYAGRELGAISERMDKQDAAMGRIEAAVGALHGKFDGTRYDRADV